MKKNILLILSIILMSFSFYAIAVMLTLSFLSDQPISGRITIPVIMLILILIGIWLLIYCFKHYRLYKYNVDILTTIYLFLVFMLSYTVPNSMIAHYLGFEHLFSFLGPIITIFSTKSIGIFEASLFAATIFCGLTIGEDKNKKYYE